MASWNTPKTDYKAQDQVVPSIFNELGENEIYLKENDCQIVQRPISGSDTKVLNIILLEVT